MPLSLSLAAALSLALVGGPRVGAPLQHEPAPPSDWSDFSDFEFVEGEGESQPAPTPDDAQTKAAPKPARRPASEIMSGSLRLTGAYLRFPEQPAPLPSGGDALLTTVGRLMVDHSWGKAKLELNLFADLSRVPSFGGLGGAFSSAGRTGSAYRHLYLTAPIFSSPAGSSSQEVSGNVGFDRMKVAVDAGRLSFEIGRFPINDSVSTFFTPNDYFAPFSATAVNRIYKPGVDAARLAYALGPLSSVEALGALGFDDGYRLRWSHSAVMLRASTVKWGFEGAVHGGKVAQRWVAGASLQGDVGRVGLRAEGHVGIPDLDGDGKRSAADKARPVHGRLAAGPNMMFDWRNLVIGAEYAFYSEGAKDPAGYIDRAQRFFPDDLGYLAQHYVGLNAGLQIIPIVQTSAIALINANDGSGLAALSAIYNVADEADLILGVFVPWGANPKALENSLIPFSIESEFGTSGLTLYMESRVFF